MLELELQLVFVFHSIGEFGEQDIIMYAAGMNNATRTVHRVQLSLQLGNCIFGVLYFGFYFVSYRFIQKLLLIHCLKIDQLLLYE